MAAKLRTEMMPVCYEIKREMPVDKHSESYKKRQREFPDEATFQLFDNNNPQRDEESLHQILLLTMRQNFCDEEEWDDKVDVIRDRLSDPEYRREKGLSDSLEIVVYQKRVTMVVELLYSEMSEDEFNTEFENMMNVIRQKGGKCPMHILTRNKKIPYWSEHRDMLIHDLRPLPPEKRARTSGPPLKTDNEE